MLDAWNRIEHNRDLADDCHRLATSTLSSQMKKRYLLMAKDYTSLADRTPGQIERLSENLAPRPKILETHSAITPLKESPT
jgi:hypothetical protein